MADSLYHTISLDLRPDGLLDAHHSTNDVEDRGYAPYSDCADHWCIRAYTLPFAKQIHGVCRVGKYGIQVTVTMMATKLYTLEDYDRVYAEWTVHTSTQ